jgi:hypothetical protein
MRDNIVQQRFPASEDILHFDGAVEQAELER